jgi:hypothetical protein
MEQIRGAAVGVGERGRAAARAISRRARAVGATARRKAGQVGTAIGPTLLTTATVGATLAAIGYPALSDPVSHVSMPLYAHCGLTPDGLSEGATSCSISTFAKPRANKADGYNRSDFPIHTYKFSGLPGTTLNMDEYGCPEGLANYEQCQTDMKAQHDAALALKLRLQNFDEGVGAPGSRWWPASLIFEYSPKKWEILGEQKKRLATPWPTNYSQVPGYNTIKPYLSLSDGKSYRFPTLEEYRYLQERARQLGEPELPNPVENPSLWKDYLQACVNNPKTCAIVGLLALRALGFSVYNNEKARRGRVSRNAREKQRANQAATRARLRANQQRQPRVQPGGPRGHGGGNLTQKVRRKYDS